MNRTVKRISTVLLLVFVGILVNRRIPAKTTVLWTGLVTRGPLQVTIDEDGQTRAHDRFTLTAPVAGVLSRIDLHEGDEVAADTIIAEFIPFPQIQEKRRKSAPASHLQRP